MKGYLTHHTCTGPEGTGTARLCSFWLETIRMMAGGVGLTNQTWLNLQELLKQKEPEQG